LIEDGGEIANEGTRAFLQTYLDNFLTVATKLRAATIES
jgi:hypothetical protein